MCDKSPRDSSDNGADTPPTWFVVLMCVLLYVVVFAVCYRVDVIEGGRASAKRAPIAAEYHASFEALAKSPDDPLVRLRALTAARVYYYPEGAAPNVEAWKAALDMAEARALADLALFPSKKPRAETQKP